MGMTLGNKIRITLFGESHGVCVGALLQGIPPGTPIDYDTLIEEIERRKPGRKGMSRRLESDECEIMSGVHNGVATGWPILLLARNNDARSKDYGFLPDHPRPGHADMVEIERSGGFTDLRGGGSQSARLTLGLVAAASQVRQLLSAENISVRAGLYAVGERVENTEMQRLNCCDPEMSKIFSIDVEASRKAGDSIGSAVECLIEGLPMGIGEPWFDGIEPALARVMMAIPGARAVEFSKGFRSSAMKGSEHNDAWAIHEGMISQESESGNMPDGALGGRSTGAPLRIVVHFKPPSSISKTQSTLHLPSGGKAPLKIKGRHDPVIGPRAVPVVEASAVLVIADLLEMAKEH
jgi:chorismate synthase